MDIPDAPRSYTQRRAHAKAVDSAAGPSGELALAHSHRVSWGPGGLLAFGSRSVRVVRLAAPEEGSGDRPDTRSARQRAVDVLEARIGATARDEAVGESDLDGRLQAYKAAVTKQGDGHAAGWQEAHAWKLIAALFGNSLDDDLDSYFAAKSSKAEE